jgi:hypothetical protein
MKTSGPAYLYFCEITRHTQLIRLRNLNLIFAVNVISDTYTVYSQLSIYGLSVLWLIHVCSPAEHQLSSLSPAIIYIYNNSKNCEWIFMTFCIGEFCEELSSHFSFHFDQTLLTTSLSGDLQVFLSVNNVLNKGREK